ncbi:MAG: hypothetical protein RLZ10_2681 [Bacteroidota bacterium]|jgi:carbamoylphosphate synthase large subunit
MTSILITSFGSNTSIGVAKCLTNNFRIIGTDSNVFYECNGYEFADAIIQIPNYDNPDYIKIVNKIVEKYNIECIIPIHDKEILKISIAKSQNKIKCKVATNHPNIIELCNNKKSINNFLSDFLKIPIVYDDNLEIKFPVIVKDNEGVSSKNIKIAHTLKELQSTNLKNKIVQEYVQDGIEYTVDCYSSYLNKQSFFYSIRKRIETKAGMSIKGEIVNNPIIGELCKRIHEKLNYKGVSNIQFIEKDGIFFFIEINPRFAGGGILTYKSGYNFPLMTINELCFSKFESSVKLKIGNKMVRYYNETFFDEKNNLIRS